jgi:hypothetical protein
MMVGQLNGTISSGWTEIGFPEKSPLMEFICHEGRGAKEYAAWRPTRVPEDNDSFCAAGFTWAKGVVDQ